MPVLEFVNPAWAKQKDYVRANARLCRRTLQGGEGHGLSVMICGAGPSLAADFADAHALMQPDAVWGCNSALQWLWNNEQPVSHGIAVAPEPEILEDMNPFPPVQYYLSSGVYGVLSKLLSNRHRKVWFFHMLLGEDNLGIADEVAWYRALFPMALCVPPSGGFNVVNIAVALAIGMRFSQIAVVGADCQLQGDQMYADGRTASQAFGKDVVLLKAPLKEGGEIVSRPEMLLSAIHLYDLAKRFPQVRLVGNTLPTYLLRTPEEQWRPYMPKLENKQVVNLKPVGI